MIIIGHLFNLDNFFFFLNSCEQEISNTGVMNSDIFVGKKVFFFIGKMNYIKKEPMCAQNMHTEANRVKKLKRKMHQIDYHRHPISLAT